MTNSSGNFLNHPESRHFQHIANLVPRAESVTKLTAVCKPCAAANPGCPPRDAAFYTKTDPSLGNGTTDLIGGSDKYQATCRSCFVEAKKTRATKRTDLQNNQAPTTTEPAKERAAQSSTSQTQQVPQAATPPEISPGEAMFDLEDAGSEPDDDQLYDYIAEEHIYFNFEKPKQGG